VGIARALARTADVLVMDESTNALDSRTRELVLETILNAYRDRIVIFVTHDPQVIARVDEVIELQLPAAGTLSETIEQPRRDVYGT
jgi:ATP-binding cassette subfamily C protein CydC